MTPATGASSLPTLQLEASLWQAGLARVAGVDEVGLGPLAGPVVVAACIPPVGCELIAGVRDSKALSASVRAELAIKIAAQAVAFGIGAASVEEIERLNVLRASRLAMRRALAKLGDVDYVLVDGRDFRAEWLGCHTAIVRGDAACYSISCASILAKVTRDRLMAKLALRYPGYGWERNAGYPTRAHIAAIREHGVTPYHRRTYRPVMLALGGVLPEPS